MSSIESSNSWIEYGSVMPGCGLQNRQLTGVTYAEAEENIRSKHVCGHLQNSLILKFKWLAAKHHKIKYLCSNPHVHLEFQSLHVLWCADFISQVRKDVDPHLLCPMDRTPRPESNVFSVTALLLISNLLAWG